MVRQSDNCALRAQCFHRHICWNQLEQFHLLNYPGPRISAGPPLESGRYAERVSSSLIRVSLVPDRSVAHHQ
jgi:hypothetical protein